MSSEKEQPIVNVQEAISKTERYIEENKKSLSIIIGAIFAVIAGYYAWTQLYISPLEVEARGQMFMAEKYFEKDSLDKAMNGDGQSLGFIDIADQYSLTSSGNLAHFYLGVCYLHKGKYEDAINELNEYDPQGEMLGPVAASAAGDAHLQLGHTEEAIEFYIKASGMKKNNFTTPVVLFKAGLAYESLGKYKDAIRIYEQIKADYPETTEGRNMEKYLARARTLSGS